METCRGHPVDFVICGFTMPGMTGPALCRALRALPLARHVYVLMLTARSDRQAVAERLQAGADFLTKPLAPGERLVLLMESLRERGRRAVRAGRTGPSPGAHALCARGRAARLLIQPMTGFAQTAESEDDVSALAATMP